MGTIVHAGTWPGIVVATGMSTEFGKIAAGLSSHQLETGFQRGLRSSRCSSSTWRALTTSIFVINIALQRPLLDALLFSLAIAVGITPQLLPAVVSTSLAAGSRRMRRQKVLVKRLVCIEDLGDVDVLFTDKTGTLTDGQGHVCPRHTRRRRLRPWTSSAGDCCARSTPLSPVRCGGNPLDPRCGRVAAVAGCAQWLGAGRARYVAVRPRAPDGSPGGRQRPRRTIAGDRQGRTGISSAQVRQYPGVCLERPSRRSSPPATGSSPSRSAMTIEHASNCSR